MSRNNYENLQLLNYETQKKENTRVLQFSERIWKLFGKKNEAPSRNKVAAKQV